ASPPTTPRPPPVRGPLPRAVDASSAACLPPLPAGLGPARPLTELVRALEDPEADAAVRRPGAVDRPGAPPHEVARRALAVVVDQRPFQDERLLEPDVPVPGKLRPRLEAGQDRPPPGGLLVEDLVPHAREPARLPVHLPEVEIGRPHARVRDHVPLPRELRLATPKDTALAGASEDRSEPALGAERPTA